VSLNLKRRHLTESQRAMVAAKLANMNQGARTDLEHSANLPEVSQPQAAAMLNISERTLRTAKQVHHEGAPELVAAVEQGKVAVSAAAKKRPAEAGYTPSANWKKRTLKILAIRLAPPGTDGRAIAHFDAEITPEIRLCGLRLVESNGRHLTYSANSHGRATATFSREFANELSRAASAALREGIASSDKSQA